VNRRDDHVARVDDEDVALAEGARAEPLDDATADGAGENRVPACEFRP
jgi:hypothetical protein